MLTSYGITVKGAERSSLLHVCRSDTDVPSYFLAESVALYASFQTKEEAEAVARRLFGMRRGYATPPLRAEAAKILSYPVDLLGIYVMEIKALPVIKL